MTREEFDILQIGDKVRNISKDVGIVTRVLPNRAINARFKRREYGWTVEQAMLFLELLPRESIGLEEII